MGKEQKDIITDIQERFISVDVKTLDAKKRINLGEKTIGMLSEKFKAETFKVYVGEDGDILLRPVVIIPEKEAWIYENPAVLKEIRTGLSEAGQNKKKRVENLDKYLEEL